MGDARPAAGNLHAMLGLPDDVSTERLRYAYDQAMAAATQRGDRNRALALSQAFDALPASRRAQLYRPAGTSTVAPRTATPPRRAVRAPGAQPQSRRSSRAAFKAMSALLALAMIYFGAPRFISYLDRQHSSVPAPTSFAPSAAAPSVPPVRVVRRRHVRRVPENAPTDSSGYVDVDCRPHYGHRGYTVFAHRGSLVRCPNGAIPRIIR